MLSYLALSQLLRHAGAEPGAAECHGFLCGQACVTSVHDEELWMEFLDVQAADADLESRCCDEVRGLMREIEAQLLSVDCIFDLLLPDDGTTLGERVDALGAWCHGFLNGFHVADEETRPALSDDGRELLKDLDMISRVGLEDPDEEDERALAEIVEYIRSGIMLLFEESRVDAGGRGEGTVLH